MPKSASKNSAIASAKAKKAKARDDDDEDDNVEANEIVDDVDDVGRAAAASAAGESLVYDDDDDDDDDDEDDDEEDDDLILEGVVVRNPDVPDEEDDEDDDDDEGDDQDDDNDDNDNDEDDGDEEPEKATVAKKDGKIAAKDASNGNGKRKAATNSKKSQKKRKNDDNNDTLQVDFTFCDMDEKYFHGLKSLLQSSGCSALYQEHSSALADLMIENVAVGTVVGTSLEDAAEADVFGFASVLNVTTYQQSPAIQFLKQYCLDHCPPEHAKELSVVLSGTTNRPAGFLLHGRMINMPLEIVQTLHEQLVLDMDWAVDHAEIVDSVDERKALDFGAFVRLAPCQYEGRDVVYKYFDDEILAQQAEFVYAVNASAASAAAKKSSKTSSADNDSKQLINVMVLTKTGHRAALADLSKLIQG